MIKNNTFTEKQKEIIEIISKNGPMRPADLFKMLNITKQRFYVIVEPLIKNRDIIKNGNTPKVFYTLNPLFDKQKEESEIKEQKKSYSFSKEDRKIIEENFYMISPDGAQYLGLEAFVLWCEKRKEDPVKVASEYVKTFEKYQEFKTEEISIDKNTNKYEVYKIIDASNKIKESFKDDVFVDKMFYIDFYAMERFGKTKLGQMLFYAKKAQDNKLSQKISFETREIIISFIKKENIDAVGFIPPTEYRKFQFMTELKNSLDLNLPEIEIVKIKTDITVPQKTLTKIEDRKMNADKTMFINLNSGKKFKKVLLIDDAVGSGASFNQVAKKIKSKNITNKIYALAIVGSFKGFDVVTEA